MLLQDIAVRQTSVAVAQLVEREIVDFLVSDSSSDGHPICLVVAQVGRVLALEARGCGIVAHPLDQILWWLWCRGSTPLCERDGEISKFSSHPKIGY